MNYLQAVRPVIATLALCSCTAPEVAVDNAWIRTPPPGHDMTAAYLDLKNGTNEAITLIAAAAEAYGSVTLHESRVIDGVWEMTAIPSLSVPAGGRRSLTPGGLHLMLMQPQHAVERGEQTTIRLEFADGSSLTVPVIVRDSAP